MWFGVLGPLIVHDGDSAISVPATRQRVLLGALLVRAGEIVPADTLAELIWDGTPPTAAATTLRTHVMRLRRVLGSKAGARVLTRHPGYTVQAAEHEVDLLRFHSLGRDGGEAMRSGDWARASDLLGEALGLWRGTPLADVPSDRVGRDELLELEQLRLQAVEWQIDAALHLGRDAELVPRLQSLTAKHPLQERFHAQLMLAMVRSGRPAEALEVYQRARIVLREELGTDPGTELRELHQRILTADPALTLSEPSARPGAEAVKPRELPGPVAHFTGRTRELAALTDLLKRSGEASREAIVISAIGGTAGVGKTALAVNWAHQVASQFPDGQLYVNLRGYDPGQPVRPADALAGFLRSLGVAGQDIPAEEAERAARYRSLLAGRRMLVLLDNASEVDQIRPLLPGSTSCAVIVTSRDAMAGLVVRDGAERLDLDLLPLGDAVGLLRALIGTRVDDDPDAAAVLAVQCCQLPLALRVTAELAVSRPAAPLGELASELADEKNRLDLLEVAGDRRTAVRAVFSWSIRHLDPEAARTFRWLGLHPGSDFDAYAVAALTGTTVEQARRVVGALAQAYLVQTPAPGRYGLHDLLHAYARELVTAQETDRERHAALTRLFDYYLYAAAQAMDTVIPAEHCRRPRVPECASPVPALTDPAVALSWLDTERATLVAAVRHTAENGWAGHCTRLAATLYRYLDANGHYPEAVTVHSCARDAARRAGDAVAEATALNNLGSTDSRRGSYERAAGYLQQSLALFRHTGDQVGEARALNNLGLIDAVQSRHERAAGRFRQALALFRQVGDRSAQARVLSNLGRIYQRQGDYQLGISHLEQALTLSRQIGDRNGEAEALVKLGTIGLRQGRIEQAAGHIGQAVVMFRETGDRSGEAESLIKLCDARIQGGDVQQVAGHIEEALVLFRETGDRSGEADALTRLATVRLKEGQAQEAASHYEDALTVYRELGERYGEVSSLNGLGETFLGAGQTSEARAHYVTALGIAEEIGDKHGQARARTGLAATYQAVGDCGHARFHWQRALALYTELGAPEAGQIRAQLAAVRDQV